MSLRKKIIIVLSLAVFGKSFSAQRNSPNSASVPVRTKATIVDLNQVAKISLKNGEIKIAGDKIKKSTARKDGKFLEVNIEI